MNLRVIIAAVLGFSATRCAAQDFITDLGVAGPPLETVHAYYDQWPTGVYVSACLATILMLHRNCGLVKWTSILQLPARSGQKQHE